MVKAFSKFQEQEEFSKKIGIVGEANSMPELYGDENSELVIQIQPNDYSTHQVFNRLAGSTLIPKLVSNKFGAQSLAFPVSTVSPSSQIKTFPNFSGLNSASLAKGSIYFSKPKFTKQIQLSIHNGDVLSARQIIDGVPVYLDTNRMPAKSEMNQVAEKLYRTLGSDLIRCRVGLGKAGTVLLAMENFSFGKPELADLYFRVYESHIGQLPEWYKHKIKNGPVRSYLNEYINRNSVQSQCSYIL